MPRPFENPINSLRTLPALLCHGFLFASCFSLYYHKQSWWGRSFDKPCSLCCSFSEGAHELLASCEPFSPPDLPLLSTQPFIPCPPQGLPCSHHNAGSHEVTKSQQGYRPYAHGCTSTQRTTPCSRPSRKYKGHTLGQSPQQHSWFLIRGKGDDISIWETQRKDVRNNHKTQKLPPPERARSSSPLLPGWFTWLLQVLSLQAEHLFHWVTAADPANLPHTVIN